jgi:hypothetical protein
VVNYNNPGVNDAIESAEKRTMLSIAESVQVHLDRTLERRVEFSPEEIRMNALELSIRLRGDDTIESLIRDASLIEQYIKEGL